MAVYTCEPLHSPGVFWNEAEKLLMAHESVHNLMIGLTLGMLGGERSYREPWFLLVRENARVVGAALQTDPAHPLALCKMPEQAVRAVAAHVLERDVRPSRLGAEALTAAVFTKLWQSHTGLTPTLGMRQGVYELGQLRIPSAQGGRLVCAGQAERVLVERMLHGFTEEALAGSPNQPPAQTIERLLPGGHLFLWQDAQGRFVSLAARNRETPTTASISMVYTPPEQRRRGYAARVVAGVSQLWLERGKRTCNLYTDLSNDTSNSVYRKLGYVQVVESHEWVL